MSAHRARTNPIQQAITLLPYEAPTAYIDEAVARMIKEVWADEGIQQTWAQRSHFQVQDALRHYCENIERIGVKKYVPEKMDVLLTRVRTSGIVEEHYTIDGVDFVMFDVGGQRNERRKWIHCFQDVTAVIFVAAINEYDQQVSIPCSLEVPPTTTASAVTVHSSQFTTNQPPPFPHSPILHFAHSSSRTKR